MNAPPSWRQWLKLNFEIGALSFGSSVRMVLYREAAVEKFAWLSADEFQEILTVVQLVPGPNLVNMAAYLGHRFFGVTGAVSAVLVLGLPSAFMAVALAGVIDLANSNWALLFRGFSIGSLALFFAFVISVVRSLARTHDGAAIKKMKHVLRLALAAVVGILGLGPTPLIPLMFGGMAVGLALEFLL